METEGGALSRKFCLHSVTSREGLNITYGGVVVLICSTEVGYYHKVAVYFLIGSTGQSFSNVA